MQFQFNHLFFFFNHSTGNAQHPETCGAAIDVPVPNIYLLSVIRIGFPQSFKLSVGDHAEDTFVPGTTIVGKILPSFAGPLQELLANP